MLKVIMARFKDTEKEQGMFLTVNLYEQLLPGTFEWALNYLIDEADMSVFEQKYSNDAKGAAAYPPKILLKAILYCYSMGIITLGAVHIGGNRMCIYEEDAQKLIDNYFNRRM